MRVVPSVCELVMAVVLCAAGGSTVVVVGWPGSCHPTMLHHCSQGCSTASGDFWQHRDISTVLHRTSTLGSGDMFVTFIGFLVVTTILKLVFITCCNVCKQIIHYLCKDCSYLAIRQWYILLIGKNS